MEMDTNINYKDSRVQWTSLAISHVEYPSGDWLGKILAIMSLCPLTLVIALVTLIIFRRDLHTITFFLGTSLNEAINWVLKHLIKELRPCRGRENLYSEYGMPSNHAQFMWFFSTYMAFFLLIRLHHGSSTYPLESAWKYVATLFFICIAAVVTYSRIYLHYHTWTQVICGACLGVLFACIWFFITQFTFTPIFPLIAAWPISEFLMLRDTTLIPNVMWFEYTSHRAESRTRQRKLVSMKSQ